MRLSTKAQYAVRALVDLVFELGGGSGPFEGDCPAEEIPLNYLEQLFFRLKNAAIVTSVRGPGGGYLLARDPAASTWGKLSPRWRSR